MRTAILDIESTNLKSDAGFLLCVGIKEYGKPPQLLSLRDFPVASRDPLHIDAALALATKAALEAFDYWLGWNQLLFDVPFLNDRLLFAGYDPLEKRFQTDLMYLARMGKSAMTSSRLDWVAKKLEIPAQKTPLDINTWKRAEAEALLGFKSHANFDKILHHNKLDLIVTEQVYNRLKPRIQTIQKR